MTSEEDIVRAFMPCPGQHANYERCPIDIDGEHDLRYDGRWHCESCGSVLRLSVWGPPRLPARIEGRSGGDDE